MVHYTPKLIIEILTISKIENNRYDKSIESFQAYLDRRILIDAELMTVINRLEAKLSTVNSSDVYSNRQNRDSISRLGNFFNKDKQN